MANKSFYRHNRTSPEVVEQIRRMVEEEKIQQAQIAKALGIGENTVSRYCKRLGLNTQRTGPRSGEGHPEWKGGRILVGGYWYVYAPDHPNATKQHRVAEHRLIMEKKLGRYLSRSEVVHHIDGNPQNNHPDNLITFRQNSEHLHHELKGNVPQWSEQGFLNMSVNRRKYQGDTKERQRQAWKQYDIRRRSKKSDGRPQPPPTDHPSS